MSTFAVEPGKSSARAPVRARLQVLARSAITVGSTTDPAEHEADRVAAELMRMPAGQTLRRCSCGGVAGADGECATCKTRRLERRAAGGDPSAVPPIVHEIVSTSGRALDSASRSYFEPRLGIDLGGVRIHDDSRAAESATAVAAHAYTVGNHIAFAGRSGPGPSALLAHELVHVAQQHGAVLQRPVVRLRLVAVLVLRLVELGRRRWSRRRRRRDPRRVLQDRRPCDPHRRRAQRRSDLAHLHRLHRRGRQGMVLPRRSGNTSCTATAAPYFGIKETSGSYVAGTVDWSPGAPSTTVLSGATACGKDTCFSSELSRIHAGCTAYSPTGPNSNTVARTLLSKCNVPQAKPVAIAPGWGDPDL